VTGPAQPQFRAALDVPRVGWSRGAG
jgi:hypothetical protein